MLLLVTNSGVYRVLQGGCKNLKDETQGKASLHNLSFKGVVTLPFARPCFEINNMYNAKLKGSWIFDNKEFSIEKAINP